ncbi:MAG TPA: Nif3-like dinuclear metal center hexameric protein [Lachnospiraceae bacterium]|nr:Nif3-like dinuclear metal center hexameric protein [Lachnospiraceae bacterium]
MEKGKGVECSVIIESLEQLCAPVFAESWDNVGLLAGRRDKEVGKICIALDATDGVIEEAAGNGADMLLTHHPLIFSSMKKVNTDDFIGRRLVKLIRNDISYYAMHTNFDVMGMADAAADEIRLKDRHVLSITYEDEIAKEGIGRYGRLPQIMTLEECASYIKEIFHLESVKIYGERDTAVECAAVSPGSGKSMIRPAIEAGAEVLITGDIEHHEGLDAMAQGLSIIDAGHYGLEKIFVPYMMEYIQREFPQITLFAAREKNPFWLI